MHGRVKYGRLLSESTFLMSRLRLSPELDMKIRYVSALRVLVLFSVALSWALVIGPGVEARLLAGEKKKSPSPYESRKVKDRVKEFEELGLTAGRKRQLRAGSSGS